MLTALTAATGVLVITLVPAHARQWPMALLIVTAAASWLRVLSLPKPPTRVRLLADGTLRVAYGALERPAELLPGSIMTPDFALLHWREGALRGRRCSALLCRADNRDQWRRARLIWRWAPYRARPRLRVDSAARALAHRAQGATELSRRPRVYGGDRGRAEDE